MHTDDTTAPQMTGWEMVVSALKVEQVSHVFGLPGNPLELYDALHGEEDIRPVLVRHEAAGGFMAMTYALLSGRPSVCFTPPGPGVAHLVAPLLESLATCAPVVALSPSVDERIRGKGAFQESDQMGMLRPVTKWAFHVATPEMLPWAIRRAFEVAMNGQPGPVFLEISPLVGRAVSTFAAYVPSAPRICSQGSPEQVRVAADLLLSAVSPVVIAGGGTRHSRAHDELERLAVALGAPVLTTPSGRGSIPEDHPLAVGQVGLYRTRLGKQLLAGADVLLVVGSRLEQTQTGTWAWLPDEASMIRIDICAEELSRNVDPAVPILGDARHVLSQLIEAVQREDTPSGRDERFERIAREKRAYDDDVQRECLDARTAVTSKRVVYEINQVFGKNTILVHENGSQDLWSYYAPYFKVLDRDGSVSPGEQTCMGAGVMGAVGAKLARPESQIVCVTGDGAFQMYCQDIPTAAQHDAPVTWIILNNDALGWIKYRQMLLGEHYVGVDFVVQPDFVALAQAYGCVAEKASTVEEIAPVLSRAREANQQGRSAVAVFDVGWSDLPEAFRDYAK